MNQKATLIAAVAVCCAAAFMLGRISSGRADAPASGLEVNGRNGGPIGPRAADQSSTKRIRHAVSSSSSQDTIERMQEIINNPDPLERAAQWVRFVKGLSPDEIRDVVISFRGMGLMEDEDDFTSHYRMEGFENGNLSEYGILLSAWAKHDPIGALNSTKNTGYEFARQTILTSWASVDPAGAMRWAEDNHEGDDANPWMVGVIRGIAANDLARASELMSAMPFSGARNEALEFVVRHHLKQGPEAAREWALGIEDENLRAGAISGIADNLSRSDPQGAADWLLASPDKSSKWAMNNVMERMAKQDLQTALSYFQSITDSSFKGFALEGLTEQLARKDMQTALELMDANQDLVSADVAYGFIDGAGYKDHALTFDILSRIQNAEQRNGCYYKHLMVWMREDMDGALNWVNQTDLPEALKGDMYKMAE